MKKLKNKKSIIIISIALILVIGIIITLILKPSFAKATVATDIEYRKTSRTSGQDITSVSSVKIDKPVPDDYSFKLAVNTNSATCKVVGGTSFGESEWTPLSNWVGLMKDGVTFPTSSTEQTSGVGDGTINKLTEFINPKQSSAGESFIICNNIGTYDGKTVNLKVAIEDYSLYNASDTTHPPFLGFYKPNETKKLGVFGANIHWIQLNYYFCGSIEENNPWTCNNPIEVKGHITYNDIDTKQGVHLIEGNEGVYTRSNSKLSLTNLNGEPYIYSTDNTDRDGLHNPESSFTELFKGKSISSVYTFSDEINENHTNASGGIWSTDLASGASLEYDSDSDAGKLGKGVKKGETITYKVTYTNDDLDNSNTITIKSVLSKGLEYVKGSAGTLGDPEKSTDSNGNTTLTWSVNMVKNSVGTLSYSAKVTDGDIGIVSNKVTVKSGNSEYNEIETLKNSVPNKSYDKESKYGKNGDDVAPGSKMKYNVKYANVYSETKKVTITETLSKYLKYVTNSSNLGEPAIVKKSNGTTTLTWTRSLDTDVQETLTYEVEVAEDAENDSKVSSKTKISIDGEEEINFDALTNKVVGEVVKKVEKEEYIPNASSPGTLAVLVRDSYTNEPVKNSKYVLYKDDNRTIASDVHGNYLENKLTDEDGVVEWNEVPYGKYILKEVEPSEIFKSGFYNHDSEDKSLINSINIDFTTETDALKWFRQGKTKGGTESGEPFIERDHSKLGDLNSDGKINMQDLTLINALYTGALETNTEKQKTKFLVAADVDNNGKCNDDTCKITKNDIKLLEAYIENPNNDLFEAFKTVYLKGSYQKRAAASVLGIPLDLKISNLEKNTPKKLKGARFVVKDENGTVYGNVEMDKTEESIYLPVGNFIITQEEAKNGYDKYETPIKISMDNEGNVELLEDYGDDIKLSISEDGNKDYLEISNTLGVTDIIVPPMDQEEKVVSDTIKQVSKTTGGFSLIVAATVATMARYGISYKLVLSRLIGLIKF